MAELYCEDKRVILESPFRAQTPAQARRHTSYLHRAMRDSIFVYKESPIASHLLYTRVLNDNDPDDRALGINLITAWIEAAAKVVVYADLGVTPGMQDRILCATSRRIPVEYRYLKKRITSRG